MNCRFLLVFATVVIVLLQSTLATVTYSTDKSIGVDGFSESSPQPDSSSSDSSLLHPLATSCEPVSDFTVTRNPNASLDIFDFEFGFTVANDASCAMGASLSLAIGMPSSYLLTRANTVVCTDSSSGASLAHRLASDNTSLEVTVAPSLLSPGLQSVRVVFQTTASAPALSPLSLDVVDPNGESYVVATDGPFTVTISEPGINHVDESAITKMSPSCALSDRPSVVPDSFALAMSFPDSKHIPSVQEMSFSITGTAPSPPNCTIIVRGDGRSRLSDYRAYSIEEIDGVVVRHVDATPRTGGIIPNLLNHIVLSCVLPDGVEVGSQYEVTFSAKGSSTRVRMGTFVLPECMKDIVISGYIHKESRITVPDSGTARRMSLLNDRGATITHNFFISIITYVSWDFATFDFDCKTGTLITQSTTSEHVVFSLTFFSLMSSFLFDSMFVPAVIHPLYAALIPGENLKVESISMAAARKDNMIVMCESPREGEEPSREHCFEPRPPCSHEYATPSFCQYGSPATGGRRIPASECRGVSVPVNSEGCVGRVTNVGMELVKVDETTLDMFLQVKSATGRIDSSVLTFRMRFSSREDYLDDEFMETVLPEIFVISDADGSELFEDLGTWSRDMFSFTVYSDMLTKRRIRFSGANATEFASKIYKTGFSVSPATSNMYYSPSSAQLSIRTTSSFVWFRMSFSGRTDPIAGVVLRFQSPGWTMGAGCSAVAMESVTEATSLFPSWPTPTLDTTSYDALDGIPFYRVPVSVTPSDARYISIRCEGAWDEGISSFPEALVGFLADDSRTFYAMSTQEPVFVDTTSPHQHYAGFSVKDASTVTVADVTPLLPQLVPSYVEDSFKIGAVSANLSDPNARVVRFIMSFTPDSYIMFPLYISTIIGTFRNVLGVELTAADTSDIETTKTANVVEWYTIGSFLCEARYAKYDSWQGASSCSVAHDCGTEYTDGYVPRCVLPILDNSNRPMIDMVLVPGSIEAQSSCMFSLSPPSLPVTSGCGAYLCKNSATDEFVPCDSPSQCIPGCRADVPITAEMIDSEPAFSYSCVKNNTSVDSALCFQSEPVTYAPTCNAVSTCAAVCTDHDDEDTGASESAGPGKRVACDSEAAWRACDICGADGQKLRYQCADSDSPMGSPVAPVSESLCSYPDDFASSRACSAPTCSSYEFACRSGANATWEHCSENDGSFGSCSEHCGDGIRSREIACALFSPTGEITGEPNASDYAACSREPTTPEPTKACNEGACPPDYWSCTEDAGSDTPMLCEDVPFPACPTNADADGCFEPKVNRSVRCFSGKDDALLDDDDACSGSVPRPDDEFVCPPVTTTCKSSYLSSTPCVDDYGTEHTCILPWIDAGTVGYKRISTCSSPEDLSMTVPSEWCSPIPPPIECAEDLSACVPTGVRWNETVDDECYTGSDAVCRSFRAISAVCEAQYQGTDWEVVGDSLCSSLPPHSVEEDCADMPSCGSNGECVPPPGSNASIGICDCSLGFSGELCDYEETEMSVALAPAPGTGNEGKYIISWFTPSMYSVNSTAVISLVLQTDSDAGDGLVIPIATELSSIGSYEFTALGLVFEGTYKARVVINSLYSLESSDLLLTPGCLAGGAAACENEGECTAKSGVCVCKGDWTGSQCSGSPCNAPNAAATCNPDGGVCAMNDDKVVCTCHTDSAGTPLFEAPSCHIPTNGCNDDLPSCAHGGVRSGSLSSSGEAQCTDCVCENKWTSASNCATCGLSCLNGGKRDDSCSECTCVAKSGYNGETCECRHIHMSFIVLSTSLPFTAPSAVSADEKTRLLGLFSTAFASELAIIMRIPFVTVDTVSEHTSSDGVRYVRLAFLVGSHCPAIAGAEVTDQDLAYVYDGVNELKALLDNAIAPSSFITTGIFENPHASPSLELMHLTAGFSAHDPNCGLGSESCPSGWGGNGVLPGESEGEVPAGKSSSGLSTGAIVGIAIGSAVGLIILVVVILCATGVIGGAAARKEPGIEMTSV